MALSHLTPDSEELSFQNPVTSISTGSVLGRNASQVSELKGQERNVPGFGNKCAAGANRHRRQYAREEGGRGQQHNLRGPNEFASSHNNPQIIITMIPTDTDFTFAVGQALSQVLCNHSLI